MIHTVCPSARAQVVASICQASLGRGHSNRRQAAWGRGRLRGCGAPFAPHQDTVNGGNRWNDLTAACEVVGDGLGAAVNAKFLAQPDDCVLNLGRDPLRRRVRQPRALRQPCGTFGFEPPPVLKDRLA